MERNKAMRGMFDNEGRPTKSLIPPAKPRQEWERRLERMPVNKAAIDLIKEFEKFSPLAYWDKLGGVWTIGWGTTARAGVGITPVEGMRISREDADMYLQRTVEKVADQIRSKIKAPINENQFGAFVVFTYNIGIGQGKKGEAKPEYVSGFSNSTVLREFNKGNTTSASKNMRSWHLVGDKHVPGLVRRREAERVLFGTPVERKESRADNLFKSTKYRTFT